MEEKIIYYKRNSGGFILFNYNGYSERYLYYNFKNALKDFKEKCNLRYKHNVKLVKDDFCITYGYLY